MKISYRWLKDYVEIDKTPEQLGDDLSLFGHELESIEKIGDDYVLDLEITPNRGDCLSILGIAREISAMYDTKLKYSTAQLTSIAVEDRDKKINIKIEKPEICPRFTARIIDNIKIGESPKWMQERLATYGFRPINNIVDVTNYVMVATGQPLHAFDYDKIKDGLMNIRLSNKDEEVMTLDGQNRILPEGAILIEDKEKIYDLAGIMGGIKSEVDEKTKTIILQGAIFDPILIRKTSKYLNHTTDASYRYERGVDFQGIITGVDMAASLIKETISTAKIGKLYNYPTAVWPDKDITLDIAKVNKLLGTNISSDEATKYLERLNFIYENGQVGVPSYRKYDIEIWQDLAEEIARMYGYNKIEKIRNQKSEIGKENEDFIRRESIKDRLSKLGFTEVYSYSFIDKKQADILGTDIRKLPEIEKPLSPETQYLRPSLLSSVLTAIAKNPWAPEINIFEIGKVFGKDGEKWQIGIATVGKDSKLLDDAKSKLNLDSEVKSIDQEILDAYKIRRPVKVVIRDIEGVEDLVGEYSEEISDKKYDKISNFPPTVRDIAFIVDSDVDAERVGEEIKNISDKILFTELFDEFESEKFGQDKKNLAYHIWLQDLKAPVKEDEASEIIKNIGETLTEKYQAKMRV